MYGFEFAHKVRVDPQDNVWAVDEGANMVIKFNPQGRVEMVLGYPTMRQAVWSMDLPSGRWGVSRANLLR